ncbi:MAG TPA: GNAT family N-acetyltransferase [Actinomycetota bacterium]|nr:GNAT family N-acetyltransferase [Actinomycetota bacterium]
MNEITERVRERYSAAAVRLPDDAGGLPPTLGLGDPVALAAVRRGETVLDLGSGPGRDLLAAAAAVGPSGRAIGVDMTPEMLDRARSAVSGLPNVTLLQGELEALPVPCSSVDVVISNCVVNLVEDKRRALVEAYRALVPGGRLAILDTAFDAEPGPAVRGDADAWCGCVGGALVASEYEALLASVGFTDVRLQRTDGECGEGCRTGDAYPVAVTATKPGRWEPATDVRTAVPADRERIEELIAQAGLPLSGLRTEDALVALSDGAVVGAVAVERRGPTAVLRSLAVDPQRRREGLGSRLVIGALEVARWSGAREVYLATSDASRFFARLGFVPVSRERARRMCPTTSLSGESCADAAHMRLGFEDPGHPVAPLRKELPTFQDNACC